jgi:leader peptidase (prepilin peptidase)/N-methyltransferase
MIRDQIRIWGTMFAALLGLAFGSFLNVCLSRWPEGESIVKPRSHCRKCGHVLAWWENVPLLSWLALRGRCRDCGAWIGWRYAIVEAAVGGLWTVTGWQLVGQLQNHDFPSSSAALYTDFEIAIGMGLFYFLLVGLAVLDAEHLWLPDSVSLPGIAAGLFYSVLIIWQSTLYITMQPPIWGTIAKRVIAVFLAAGIILLIRWTYWLIRRREGIGFGDAKLMALLAAWLGFEGALLAFGLGVVLGAMVGLVVIIAGKRRGWDSLGLLKLPLGTFLCIGGIVSALWGQHIINAYMHWVGF